MASCWEYDQVLGSVIAEEDYLRDGRVPSRTFTALCANLGHGLNVWKTAGYCDDPSDLMMPLGERLNALTTKSRGAKGRPSCLRTLVCGRS